MLPHLAANACRQHHAVLEAPFELQALLVALVVHPGEDEHVKNEQRAADGDRDAERRRVGGVVVSVARFPVPGAREAARPVQHFGVGVVVAGAARRAHDRQARVDCRGHRLRRGARRGRRQCGRHLPHFALVRVRIVVVVEEVVHAGHLLNWRRSMQIRYQIRPHGQLVRAVMALRLQLLPCFHKRVRVNRILHIPCETFFLKS